MKRPKFTLRNETRSGSERRRSKKAERNELASTRRQVIRDLGLATGAVAIGGAVATRLFPDDAQATVERASREATVAEIAKLTSNGRIAMTLYGHIVVLLMHGIGVTITLSGVAPMVGMQSVEEEIVLVGVSLFALRLYVFSIKARLVS